MKNVILIIEDEEKIARFLELELKHEGYEVEVAYDGRTGYDKAVNGNIDLIILDLMLPELSGIEVCRRVRKVSDVPIIMLTAKDDISDKVMGLDMGADDYITKPFAIEELLARIRTALRRKSGIKIQNNDINQNARKNIIKAGNLELSKDEYKVTYSGEEINLSKKEFELLLYLMENKDIVLSREKILENVWGYDFMGDTNITDVYIRYLRSKIDQRFGMQFIHTVRGVGYIFKEK
ncbi:MAG TPA: response regulator transcription factor [Clostridiaceae bacterium]|nr:response regulator transcription factor [Clostridiaceae bacterium]